MQRIALLRVSLLTLTALAGCTTSQFETKPTTIGLETSTSNEPYFDGREALATGNPANAVWSFRSALRTEPDSIAALNGLAIAYDELGRPDTAETVYHRALTIAPDSAQTRNNFGRSLLRRGQAERALEQFELARSVTSEAAEIAIIDANSAEAQHIVTRSVAPSLSQAAVSLGDTMAVERIDARTHLLQTKATQPNVLASPGTRVSRRSSRADRPPDGSPNQKPRALPSFSLEVSNGAGRNLMAARLGQFLRQRGFPKARLTNAANFARESSVIYYRGDYLEEAQELARRLPADMRLVRRESPFADIQLIIGHDLLNFDDELQNGSSLV